MKHIVLLILSLCVLNACKKNTDQPYVNPISISQVGSIPTSFLYHILLEEFTGETYTSAVNGTDTIKELKTEYGNLLNVISIHKNDFLELAYYNQLMDKLGPIGGFPRASLNRIPAQVGTQLNEPIISSYEWRSNIENIKNKSAKLGIAMVSNEVNNVATVNVFVGFNTPITDSCYLTLCLVESDVVAINQINAPANYKHQNVLRKVITLSLGEYIKLTNDSKYVQKEYRGINVSGYNKANLKLVAFVHYFGATNKNHEVYNSLTCGLNETVKWN